MFICDLYANNDYIGTVEAPTKRAISKVIKGLSTRAKQTGSAFSYNLMTSKKDPIKTGFMSVNNGLVLTGSVR